MQQLTILSFAVLFLVLMMVMSTSSTLAHLHQHHHLHSMMNQQNSKENPDDDNSLLTEGGSTCIHDTVIIPHMKKQPPAMHPGTEYHPEARRGAAHPLAVGNLRIVLRTEDLTTSGRFCAAATGSVPDFLGGTIACSSSTIFNSTKLAMLRDQILPAAIQKLSDAIQVNQVTGTINPSSTSVCSPFTIPSTDVSTGVSNADLVLYVAAAPIASSTTIAWAGTCQVDSNGRPTVGKINFSPAHLNGHYDNDESFRLQTVNTAVHEILHTMGFNYNSFTKNFTSSGSSSIVSTTTRRGKTVYQLTSSNVLAAAKTHFGCTSLTGVELEDGDAASITADGTALSHFERRLFRNEMMTGISSRNSVLSSLTLGILQDSGHYFPVSSKAENLRWGNGGGCSFVDSSCGTTAGGMGTYFCQTASDKTCNFDNRSFGVCTYTTNAADISPSWFRHFTNPKDGGSGGDLMDYCPIVVGYSNFQCDETTRQPSTIESELGFVFGSSSRCFVAPDFKKSGSSASAPGWRGRCMSMTCNSASSSISITLSDSTVVNCPSDGSAGTVSAPSGWIGSITCPAYSEMCTGIATDLPTTSTSGGSTTTSTTTTTTTTSASEGITTATPVTTLPVTVQPGYIIKIKGGFSLRTLYSTRQTALIAALQSDAAAALGLSTSDVSISLSLDNATASIGDTAVFVTIYASPNNMFAFLSDTSFYTSVGVSSPSWLQQTQALHLQVGANSVSVESVNATTTTSTLTMSSSCDAACAMFVVVSIFAGSTLIGILLWIGREMYWLCGGTGLHFGAQNKNNNRNNGENDDDDGAGNEPTQDQGDYNMDQEYDDEGYPIERKTVQDEAGRNAFMNASSSTSQNVMNPAEQKKRAAINRLLHSDPVEDHLGQEAEAQISNDPNHQKSKQQQQVQHQSSSSYPSPGPTIMSAPPKEEDEPSEMKKNPTMTSSSTTNEPFAEQQQQQQQQNPPVAPSASSSTIRKEMPTSPMKISNRNNNNASQPNFDQEQLDDRNPHPKRNTTATNVENSSSTGNTVPRPPPTSGPRPPVASPKKPVTQIGSNNINSDSNLQMKTPATPPRTIPKPPVRIPSKSSSTLPTGPPPSKQ